MSLVYGKLPFNKTNGNSRFYTLESMKSAIDEFKDKVDNGLAIGELGHPDHFETSMSNVSHQITNISLYKSKLARKEKKRYIKTHGRLSYLDWQRTNGGVKTIGLLLSTNKGKQATIMKDELCLSPRATGTVKDNQVLVEKIFSFDLIRKNEYSFNKRK